METAGETFLREKQALFSLLLKLRESSSAVDIYFHIFTSTYSLSTDIKRIHDANDHRVFSFLDDYA